MMTDDEKLNEQVEEYMDELVDAMLPAMETALATLAHAGVVRIEVHPTVWPAMHRRFLAMHDEGGTCDDPECRAEDPTAAIPLMVDAPNGGRLELQIQVFEPCDAAPECGNCALEPFPPAPPERRDRATMN
jgi:hypothetical protein